MEWAHLRKGEGNIRAGVKAQRWDGVDRVYPIEDTKKTVSFSQRGNQP